jgi:tRNA nucleotidyltransferase/poly(A) polymerase
VNEGSDSGKPAASVADADWFRKPELAAIFAALNRDGHEARVVGGAPRNTLMGLPAGDVDFATTAPPETVARFAAEAGLKPVPTGIDHGTLTIVSSHVPFEVTTLRRDVETHGRRATVAFTQDWAEDAARRDFTINALYADASGQVFDPLGGLPDLKARRVRFIGSARDRIREDYLRILRFFRFTADYAEGPPDAEGLAACIRERGGLAGLSAERIRAELLRILATRRPLAALEPMAESGILIAILGGVARLAHFERLAAIEARLGVPPVAIRRLAALAVMVEEDAGRLGARLRLSNAESRRLSGMAAQEPRLWAGMAEADARAALYKAGAETFRDRLLIAAARDGGDAGLFDLPDRWQPPQFPIKGKHLMSCGFAPGPEFGDTLKTLEARWIASDFTLSRAELLAMAKG